VTDLPRYRCGYCSSPADEGGRCPTCGSALYDCHRALEGAVGRKYLERALMSRDRAWEIVTELKTELHYRRLEDRDEGRDVNRFVGHESPYDEHGNLRV
jgi:hypothetical protein